MPRVDIDNVAAIGIIKDSPDSELPQNAWTGGENIRFDRGAVRKFLGDEAVFEGSISLLGSPRMLLPVRTETNYYWLYPSDTRIYATDGDTHVDISESATASLTYTTDADYRWNGGVLNGLAVLNNSYDAPVYWNPSLGNDVAALPYDDSAGTTWADITAAPKCAVIRPFKEFLVAMDITEGGVRNQRQLWWSHPAEAGDLPHTWDYSKTNYFAAQNELAETQGIIVDGMPLRNDFCIYKSDSIYRMTYTGLPNIFSFRKEIESIGALGRDCAMPFFGKHVMFGQGDVVLHNFNETHSIIDDRMKRWLYSIISTDNYQRSFVVANRDYNEIWCCFPEQGADYPNLAMVWNWSTGACTIRELNSIVHGTNGIIDPTVQSTTFDSTSGTFNTDFGAFGETAFNPSLQKTVLAKHDATSPKILLVDETNQFNGSNMTAYVERTCMPLGRQAADGSIRIDTTSIKHVTRIYPRIRASAGAIINIYIGTQSELDGTVSWKHTGTYDCDNDYKHDCRVSGRIFAIKFESTTNISWDLDGYAVEWHYGGDR